MTPIFEKLVPEKQQTILDAAAYVFARKGYHQANVIDICKKAGISNGALYNYFENKKDLFIDVFSSHINRLANIFDRLYHQMEQRNSSFFNIVDEMLDRTLEYVEREEDYLKIYYDIGSASMEEFISDLSRKLEKTGYDYLVKLVKKGQERGEIRKDINPDIAAYMIDSHFMLLHFSCISQHYAKRFTIYFKHDKKNLNISIKEKIKITKLSLMQLLT